MKVVYDTGVLVLYMSLCAGAGLPISGMTKASPTESGGTSGPLDTESGSIVRRGAVLEPASSVDLHNESGQDTTVLFIVPKGKVVGKGGLLIELDSSSLQGKRDRLTAQLQETEMELRTAQASLARVTQETPMQAEVAELGLAVAEGALNAFVQAEYPLQVKTAE